MREKLSSMELAMMRKAAAMRRPIHGSLELTPLCNMNCDMCYIRLSPTEMAARGKLRTVNEWIALSEQMQRAGVLFLLLTGGEPLLYPGFKELFTHLKKAGMILTVNTNGTLIENGQISLPKICPGASISLFMGQTRMSITICVIIRKALKRFFKG